MRPYAPSLCLPEHRPLNKILNKMDNPELRSSVMYDWFHRQRELPEIDSNGRGAIAIPHRFTAKFFQRNGTNLSDFWLSSADITEYPWIIGTTFWKHGLCIWSRTMNVDDEDGMRVLGWDSQDG